MSEPKRKSISFTPQHRLEDVAQDYVDAIYRFRRAEEEHSSDYTSAKLEMIRLEARLRNIREHIYRGTTYELFEPPKAFTQSIGCPEPAWV